MNDLVKQENYAVAGASVTEVIKNVQIIQQVLDSVMKKGTHYDVVPGCGDKPALLKPGAEAIMSTFKLGPEFEIEKETDGFDIDYTITVRGFYIPTGNTVGYGLGFGSTREEKYAWREAVCDEEFEATPVDQRRTAYKKHWNKSSRSYDVKAVKQVRQTPASMANTVLKMAKKRALVDFCLTATACSDMFVQDMEENTDGGNNQPQQHFQQPRQQAPQQNQPQGGQQQPPPNSNGHRYNQGDLPDNGNNRQPANDNCITQAQSKRLFAIAKNAGVETEALKEHLVAGWGIEHTKDIKKDAYDQICAWAQAGGQEPQ